MLPYYPFPDELAAGMGECRRRGPHSVGHQAAFGGRRAFKDYRKASPPDRVCRNPAGHSPGLWNDTPSVRQRPRTYRDQEQSGDYGDEVSESEARELGG